MNAPPVRLHELAFRTQYAELKERARAAGALLPGTPGTLVLRSATGRSYWYRAYQSAAGRQVEDLVGRDGDADAHAKALQAIEFARWVAEQVRSLRKLDFQVADKGVAQVLVELHNAGLLAAGLCLVGTLAYMAWLNELGGRVVAARTQDIDLATPPRLALAAPQPLLPLLQATKLGFHAVPGLSAETPSTSLKLAGAEGLRVDLLTHGEDLGAVVAVKPLQWHAQTVPHYDFLLQQPREAAVLAGAHCVPVQLPDAPRFVWHKLYAGVARRSFPEKAQKDLRQALTLAELLCADDGEALDEAAVQMPPAMQGVLRRQRLVIGQAARGAPALVRAAIERALRAA